MILIETSVLVDAVRDRSGAIAQRVLDFAGDREIVLSSFSQLELLVGAKDDAEWQRLSDCVDKRRILQPQASSWAQAARIYFDLRRRAHTVRSLIDCCIAQIALEQDILFPHDDRDFEAIARVRSLRHHRANFKSQVAP